MTKTPESLNSKEQHEENPNNINVYGEQYQIVGGVQRKFHTEERSHGYGNAYVRKQRVGSLIGTITVLDKAANEATMFQVTGSSWDEKAAYDRSNPRNLHSALSIERAIDETVYTDAVGNLLMTLAEAAEEPPRYKRHRTPVYSADGMLYLNLIAFGSMLREYLKEVGAVPESGGQIRLDVKENS